ncbi:hypothetical protein, partial [Polaromonas sp.]|uniref:hypothetical protein n=1 Tax=Polaromonas sp. TaxID=1869339 RepID=UPI002730A247
KDKSYVKLKFFLDCVGKPLICNDLRQKAHCEAEKPPLPRGNPQACAGKAIVAYCQEARLYPPRGFFA